MSDTKTTSAENFPDSILAKPNGVKKTKTPRNYDSILKGALALELEDRVNLKRELIKSIETEVKDLKQKAELAENLMQDKF